ncbi:hypothetical protein Tco_0857171 [Tanacetum coccineum]|uniref:Uncharacterized protein n=1 Tax=Tanacetum coccineum TaxID=301880 RepID=A0ABQ5B7B7_9ASTR
MEISIADQIALDDALVAPADRLKIGKCNLRLSSDVTSKEATLQVVYDVLKLTPFYKAFQVTADAPEIYMQEFWASAYVHNRSDKQNSGEIRKITTSIVNKLAFNPGEHLLPIITNVLSVALTNEDIRNSDSYKEYYAIASGTIPSNTKGRRRKADTDTTTKNRSHPQSPKKTRKKISLEKGKAKL